MVRMAKFKPGQSGNPGGRPTVVKTIQHMAREKTPEVIKALLAALERPRERVAAATVLLAYGYGRPVQATNVRVIRSIQDLTGEELDMLETAALEEAERTGRP